MMDHVDHDKQFSVEDLDGQIAVEVRGVVDEVVALELGALLDDAGDAGREAVHLDLRSARLDVMSWVIMERAIRRCRRRGAAVRTAADDSVETRSARRDAQRWLAAVRAQLR